MPLPHREGCGKIIPVYCGIFSVFLWGVVCHFISTLILVLNCVNQVLAVLVGTSSGPQCQISPCLNVRYTLVSRPSTSSGANFRCRLRVQPVDATQALNLLAGVSNSNVSRGRSHFHKIIIYSYQLGRYKTLNNSISFRLRRDLPSLLNQLPVMRPV